MIPVLGLLALVGGVNCLIMAYRVGKRILVMLPDNAEPDAFAGSISRVIVLNDNPEIRSQQKILIKWIAAALLCVTIARYAQMILMTRGE